MTGPEADRLGARLALHLRKNEFQVCHHILDSKEVEMKAASHDRVTAIAELNLNLRYVNMLERAGFIYVTDLDHVDIRRLVLRSENNERNMIAEVGRRTISDALGRTWEEEEDD